MIEDSTPTPPCGLPQTTDLDGIDIPPNLQRFLENLPCSIHSKRLGAMEGTLQRIEATSEKTLRALVGEPDLKRPGLIDIAESNRGRIEKLENDRATVRNEAKGGLKTITTFGGFLAWAVVVIGGVLGALAYLKSSTGKP